LDLQIPKFIFHLEGNRIMQKGADALAQMGAEVFCDYAAIAEEQAYLQTRGYRQAASHVRPDVMGA